MEPPLPGGHKRPYSSHRSNHEAHSAYGLMDYLLLLVGFFHILHAFGTGHVDRLIKLFVVALGLIPGLKLLEAVMASEERVCAESPCG